MAGTASAPPGRRGLAWRLVLLGLVGVASLALAPLEELVPVPIDPLALRLLALVQPTMLVLAAVAVGLWAAPKVGLDAPALRAWAEGRPVWPALRVQLAPAALGGLAVAAVLLAHTQVVTSHPAVAASMLAFEIPLVSKLLYGGIVEELLLRWGLMSLLAWVAWRLAGRPAPVPGWVYGFGLTATSLLFAVGHLPALYLLVPAAPGWLLASALGGNLAAGLVFGWLFWRRGLEAAMVAHALAHLLATLAA
jgi:hypothetical protein